jgi:hypothetical protein
MPWTDDIQRANKFSSVKTTDGSISPSQSPTLHPTDPLHTFSIHFLTDVMEQSHSSEANSRLVSQETLRFYGTKRLITVFTKAHHWFLSSSRSIQSTSSNFKIHFNIILHLRLGLLSGFKLKFHHASLTLSWIGPIPISLRHILII